MAIQKQIGFHRVYFRSLLEYEQTKSRAMSLGLRMSVYIRELIVADLRAHGYDTLATREEINARGTVFVNQSGYNPPRPMPTEEEFEDLERLSEKIRNEEKKSEMEEIADILGMRKEDEKEES